MARVHMKMLKVTTYEDNADENQVRCRHTPTKMAISKGQTIPSAGENMKKLEPVKWYGHVGEQVGSLRKKT